MTLIDTAPLEPAPSTPSVDLNDHLTVLAEAVRDDQEHYEDPPITCEG